MADVNRETCNAMPCVADDQAVSNGNAVSRHELVNHCSLRSIASLVEVAGTAAAPQAYHITKALQDFNQRRHPPFRVFVFLRPTAIGPISGQPHTQALGRPLGLVPLQ